MVKISFWDFLAVINYIRHENHDSKLFPNLLSLDLKISEKARNRDFQIEYSLLPPKNLEKSKLLPLITSWLNLSKPVLNFIGPILLKYFVIHFCISMDSSHYFFGILPIISENKMLNCIMCSHHEEVIKKKIAPFSSK